MNSSASLSPASGTCLKISVPAKTMLCGEYDILTAGGKAIALALDMYLRVLLTIRPQPRASVTVASDYWGGERIINASNADDADANDLLTMLVKELILPLNRVEFIKVTSQYLPSYGFGTSSALILAMHTAKACVATTQAPQPSAVQKIRMRDELNSQERDTIVRQAHNLQQRIQGQASGYDIATQWHGGLLEITAPSAGQLKLQALPAPNHLDEFLHIYVGGKGASTPKTLASTSSWINTQKLTATIRKHSHDLRIGFLQALQQANELSTLIAAAAAWRQVFAASPCFPTHIATLLTSLQGCDQTWTFKTSGAGGEDALLLIGYRQHLQAADQALRKHGWHTVSYQPNIGGLFWTAQTKNHIHPHLSFANN